MNRTFGWAAALVSVFAFSVTTPIGRSAIVGGMDPTALVSGRYLLTTLLMAATIAVTAPGRFRIDRRGLALCGAAGLANALTMLAYFWALSRLSASIASMLVSLYPLAVLLLLSLRGEKFTYRNSLRLMVGLVGLYLLIGPGGRADALGVLLVVAAVCAYAIYLALIQWYLQDYDAWTATYYMLLATTLAVLGFWLVQGAQWQRPGGQGWLAIIILALVGTYLSRLAVFAAVGQIGSGQLALLAPLETLLTVLWAVLFLQEQLAPLQWLGGGLIVISVALVSVRLRRVVVPAT